MPDEPNPRPDEDAPAPARRPRRPSVPVALSVAAAVAATVAVVSGARLFADDPGDVPDGHPSAGGKPRHEYRQPRFSLQVGRSAKQPWFTVLGLRNHGQPKPADTVRAPSGAGPAQAIVEAPHNTFFVAAVQAKRCETRLYRFRLAGDGHVIGIRPVSGGALPGIAGGPAVSPDGNRIAFASAPCAGNDGEASGGGAVPRLRPAPPALSVLDTTTGRRRTWTATGTAALGEIVWAADGRTLGYTLADIAGGNLGPVTVHALDTAASGTDLRAGRVLFRQTAEVGKVGTAIMSADGRSGHGTGERAQPPATVLFSFEEGRIEIGSTIPHRDGRGVGVMVSTGEGPRYACLNGVDAFDRTMSGGFEAPAPFPVSCSIAWGY
ncbi:TolB-like translocation protein [Actinomadura napierensis]|uniref:Lactonase family protein n=1 Tax=Actinomadura napierensis TaxID=267854 RepID=A0ABN3A5V7_9ACTN